MLATKLFGSENRRFMGDELYIIGGEVVDGTGREPFRADISVRDGRISAVGEVCSKLGTRVIDATGLLVCPGFIDIHSHSDMTLVIDPRAVSSVTQGVTLEVVGNCGHGCAPIFDSELARSNIYGCRSDSPISWRTVAEYLDVLESRQPAVNVLTLVPNGNLRLAVMGLTDRPSDDAERRKMKDLLARGLEDGAFGFSTGLEYGTEEGCSQPEIAQLCQVVADAGGIYATHTRNRLGEAREAISEAIETASTAQVKLQISHISVVARLVDDGRWAVQQALDQVDRARDGGLDVGFDMHTRLFGTTNLSAALPPSALADGKGAIAACLVDPSFRRGLSDHRSIITALARDDWGKIIVFASKANPDVSRRSIADIAHARGAEPLDVICDLLLDEIDDLHSLMIVALTYREQDLQPVFERPDCMVGSDATALANDGPLAGTTFHGAFTWASWFYRHFVIEKKLLSRQEAVRRLTSLPASRLGLPDRGVICAGAWADLAVFDPVQFGQRGTLFEPNRPAVGMKHVLVNGVIEVENGSLTQSRGGQVLRRR